MPSAAIPFPTSSAPGLYAEGGGRLINVYSEKLPDGRIKRSRVPGLREAVVLDGYSGYRGSIYVNGVWLVAMTDWLFAVTYAGGVYNATLLGSLPGEGPVFFARNNKTPTPDIVCVAESTAYELTTSGAPQSYSDPNVGSPNAVTYLRSYFVFSYGDARMRTTGNNTTSINSLDTAFAESNPDGLLRPIALGGDLYACGPQTIEIWRVDPNNDVGFPFSYLDTIPRGIAGQQAIAGYEDGWSNTLIFVGDDGVVYLMQGYTPRAISTPSVAAAIEALPDKSTIRCSVYMHEGHAIWTMTSPDWTWCYDLSTGEWFERKSHLMQTWRCAGALKAFDRWMAGDVASGTLYEIDPDYHMEGDDPLTATIVSATVSPFPNRAVASQINLDILAGVGMAPGADPIQTKPKCSISWSKDGGVRWSFPVLREIGRQGEYRRRVEVNRLGLMSNHGMQVRVDVSDPVPFMLFGGEVVAEARG